MQFIVFTVKNVLDGEKPNIYYKYYIDIYK